jgi:hypothetical protein
MQFFTVVALSFAVLAQAKPLASDNKLLTRAVPEAFVCAQDSDCVQQNVGNCCGYYPMCASTNAVLPFPCPDGNSGICAFPEIDSCKCGSQGGCMSLFGEDIVHGQEYQ